MMTPFLKKFTRARSKIEQVLIVHKELIATILQKSGSKKRVDIYCTLINEIYLNCLAEKPIDEVNVVEWAGLAGKIIVGSEKVTGNTFSDETKSKVFIHNALKTSLKCPICQGYIDSNKSVSYDHIIRKEDGGLGTSENAQLTHPYCNQSIKN